MRKERGGQAARLRSPRPLKVRSKGSETASPSARDEVERLSRFVARAGVASRRRVDSLIEEGRVTVNGRPAVLGQKIRPGKDRVLVDGREIDRGEKPVYILLYKPPGYLSTCSDPHGRRTVMSLLKGVSSRVFPVGRLDYDAEGLMLMTNDGKLAYLLSHPKHRVVKEYAVEIDGDRDESKIRQILSGIIVGGKKVTADYARFASEKGQPLRLIIGVHEGEKHLVKHICHSVGYGVNRLIRTRVGSLGLTGLNAGAWRYLSPKEVEDLYAAARKGWEGERGK